MLKRIGEQVQRSMFAPGSAVVLLLPPEFDKVPHVIEEVETRVSRAFILNRAEPASSAFHDEMQGIREQILEAIQASALVQVENLSQVYLQIAETILETLVRYGVGYSAKQAQEERHGLFSDWNEVSWLRDDIRSLLVAAAQTGNADLIRKVFYMPIAIAVRAVQVKDHLLFQEFLGFAPFLYHLGRDKSEQVKEMTSDRAWRHLKETTNYFIESKLRDSARSGKIDDLESYKDFAVHTFKVFQSLLKSAFDNRDIETFQAAFKEFQKLFEHLDLGADKYHVGYLEQTLAQAGDEEERLKIQHEIDSTNSKLSISKALDVGKEQVTFGLAAWCLYQIRTKPDEAGLQEFFAVLDEALPGNLSHLAEVYEKSRTIEVESFWGWGWWESIPDGEVHSIDVFGKLDAVFCVKALRILAMLGDKAARTLVLPHTRNLANQVAEGDGGALTGLLAKIKANAADWVAVLNDDAIGKIDILVELLQQLKATQEEAEADILKNAQIDEDMLQKFKSNVLEEMKSAGHLRGIMQALGVLKDYTDDRPGPEVPSFGYNRLDDKAAFLTDWHVSYVGWGSSYGRGLGTSEDQVVFRKMLDGMRPPDSVGADALIETITNTLAERNFSDPIIIQTLVTDLEWELVRKSELFIAPWRDDCPDTALSGLTGFMGILKINGSAIPIVDLHASAEDLKNKLVIADMDKLGIWKQYSPVDEPGDEDYCIDHVFLQVIDLNKNEGLRTEIIDQGAEWLNAHEDKEGYLRQKVVVKLFEKLDFEIKDGEAGVCFQVRQPEEPDADAETSEPD